MLHNKLLETDNRIEVTEPRSRQVQKAEFQSQFCGTPKSQTIIIVAHLLRQKKSTFLKFFIIFFRFPRDSHFLWRIVTLI